MIVFVLSKLNSSTKLLVWNLPEPCTYYEVCALIDPLIDFVYCFEDHATDLLNVTGILSYYKTMYKF